MASKSETPTDLYPKPQNETNPEFDSVSSTTEVSSQTNKLSVSSSDPKSQTLPSNKSEFGYPSFSKLLEGVVAANSAVSSNPIVQNIGFQGQFGMSHQEALASVTAKAAQAHAQMQIQAEPAKTSIEPPPMALSESSLPSSSSVVQEQMPLLQQQDHVQERSEKKSSHHTSETADTPGQKLSNMQSDSIIKCALAPVSSPKEKADKDDAKQGDTSRHTNEHADDIPKTPKPDGYGWRKYGQKQVKCSGSSRSYYRCTHFNCYAKKKVQHLDVSGQIIAVVYKGDHNHDPPQNPKGSNRKRDAPSAAPVPLNESSEASVQKLDDPHTSTSRRGLEQAVVLVPSTQECRNNNLNTSASTSQRDAGEKDSRTPDPSPRIKSEVAMFPAVAEHCRPNNSNELAMTDPMKERDLAPLKKRRIKERGKAYSEAVYRTFKEPKIVVHATGDAGSSCDGYRWRKYGQKMVKGNPHPRSYYRCSSAGCPVRKHVERATDNSTAIIVTYEGKHNHDVPVPKKQHGSPNSTVRVVNSATAATSTPSQKSDTETPSSCQGPQRSKDVDGDLNEEKVPEAGADKVLESARTLLSIGIELKSC